MLRAHGAESQDKYDAKPVRQMAEGTQVLQPCHAVYDRGVFGLIELNGLGDVCTRKVELPLPVRSIAFPKY